MLYPPVIKKKERKKKGSVIWACFTGSLLYVQHINHFLHTSVLRAQCVVLFPRTARQ